VAVEIVRRALDHVSTLVARTLSPGFALRPMEPSCDRVELCLQTDLYWTLLDFAAYAIRGHALDGDLEDYLLDLLPLYATALGPPATLEGLADSEPSSELGVLIAAAIARDALAQGKALTTSQLAVLAGLSRRQVQQLIDTGEIRARLSTKEHREGPRGGAWLVPAKLAATWLHGRGVFVGTMSDEP
jgi:hypothetical protein